MERRERIHRNFHSNMIWRLCLLLLIVLGTVTPGVLSFVTSSSSPPKRRDHRRRHRQHNDQVTPTIQISMASSSSPRIIEDDPSPRETTRRKVKGTIGNWEEVHGNWVLRPPSREESPRAVLHFLGGALVGASPHITYRYMLERMADQGYLVIATPYQLSFDHLETCDDIITKFEALAPSIARQYGALPCVGVGHSCGALLQLLITSLFPDTPRAANALMSFNNKPVTDAVPFFDEVFAPLFTSLAAKDGPLPSSNEALSLYLKLAKAATQGM